MGRIAIQDGQQAHLLLQALRQRLRRRPRLPKAPRQRYAASAERHYQASLVEMMGRLPKILEPLLRERLARMAEAHSRRPSRQDEEGDDELSTLFDEVRVVFGRQTTEAEITALVARTGREVNYWQARQLEGTLKRVLDIDILSSEPWLGEVMDGFIADNVRLIKSLPEGYLGQVETIVRQGLRQGTLWDDMEGMLSDVADRAGVLTSRTELIARDQVGKFQGQLNMERQTDLGVTKYIWRTAQDERVRDEHAMREGEEFSWDSPPSDGHPGEPIQCRCYAEPVLESVES